ncbi:helix-turn-helix transcriptional regulator [Amycolatopsis alba]|nr:helix-turn-helix transcriptional regulator [Amycolatopsis alba]
MRRTREMRRLTDVFLAGDVQARFSSGDLRREANITNQRLATLLEVLRDRGWVTHGWGESSPGAPPYYMLTDVGRRELAE